MVTLQCQHKNESRSMSDLEQGPGNIIDASTDIKNNS